jgi:nicotinamide riboside kinase
MTTRNDGTSLRIAVSGTYSTGKTTTTEALSLLTGIPRTHAKTMREILPEALPGKTLEDCRFAELYQLGVVRFTERAVRESNMQGGFLSDGSSLHEWVYGKARMIVGINPNDGPFLRTVKSIMMRPYRGVIMDINENFGAVVKRHAKATYHEFIHLPVEFPLVEDGHRPVSEEFRRLSDVILRQTLDELQIKYHIVSGTIEERLARIVDIYNLEMQMPIDDAVAEARRRVRAGLMQIEEDAKAAAERRRHIPWYARAKERLFS